MSSVAEQSPEWVDEAPSQIRESKVLTATPTEVWEALIDNETWVDWFPGFRACRFTTPAPHGPGSLRFVHQDQFKVEERITTWRPGLEWGMTVVSINVPVLRAMAENVRITEVDEATTEVHWHIGVATSGWARPLRPILLAKSRKGLKQALTQLDAKLQ